MLFNLLIMSLIKIFSIAFIFELIFFRDQHVNVDQNTAVYKMVHHTDKPRSTPAQSRSIKILDALLEHGQEIPQKLL